MDAEKLAVMDAENIAIMDADNIAIMDAENTAAHLSSGNFAAVSVGYGVGSDSLRCFPAKTKQKEAVFNPSTNCCCVFGMFHNCILPRRMLKSNMKCKSAVSP